MQTITTDKFGDLTFDGSQRAYRWNNSGQTIGVQLKFDGNEYTFIPQNIVEKGFVKDDKQYYLGNVLVNDNLKKLGTEGQYIDLAGVADYDSYLPDRGLSTAGFLVPSSFTNESKILSSVRSYDASGKDIGKGMSAGAIKGISLINEKPVYVTEPKGKAQSTWIQPPGTSGYDGQGTTGSHQGRYTYTRSNFGAVGRALGDVAQVIAGVPFLPEIIGFMTGSPMTTAAIRGAAGGASGQDPLEAGLRAGVSAAGVQAGLNVQAGLDPITGAATTPVSVGGTPGVSEVYQVAPPGGTSAPLPPQSFGTGISGAGLTSAEMAALRGGAGYGETVQSLLNQDLAFVGADAAQLYNTTGSVAATQQNLLAAGVDPTMAAEASNLAALGGTGASIASSLGTAFPGETVFTSQGLLSSGATLDPIAKDIAGISTTGGSSIGITDALRGMNLANQLMGGQQPMGMPQQQAPFQPAGVDYSGILGLLGRQASTPNIQGLLGPAQIRYPNSLLG